MNNFKTKGLFADNFDESESNNSDKEIYDDEIDYVSCHKNSHLERSAKETWFLIEKLDEARELLKKG